MNTPAASKTTRSTLRFGLARRVPRTALAVAGLSCLVLACTAGQVGVGETEDDGTSASALAAGIKVAAVTTKVTLVPASPAGQIANGNGGCLDLPNGNTLNGTLIDISQCTTTGVNQTWFVDAAGSIHYGANPLKCIDFPSQRLDASGNPIDMTQLQLWDCNGASGPDQVWSFGSNNRIQFAHDAAKCVELRNGSIVNGTPVQVFSCNGTTGQTWSLLQGGPAQSFQLKDGNGACLDLPGGNATNGALLQLQQCNSTGQEQAWYTDGKSAIHYAANPSKCIDFPAQGWTSTGFVPMTQLQVWDCNGGGGPDQVIPLLSNHTLKVSGKPCIEARNGSSANGTAVQGYTCNGTTGQTWFPQPLFGTTIPRVHVTQAGGGAWQSIEGTSMGLLFNYEAKGASAPADVSVAQVIAAAKAIGTSVPPLPPSLTTPLSAQFDAFWMASPAAGVKSPHDQMIDNVKADIAKGSSSQGHAVSGTVVTVPTSGTLSAVLTNTGFALDYDVGQVTASFTEDTMANFQLTFDVDVELAVYAGSTPCQINSFDQLMLSNANVQPTNAVATVSTWLSSFVNLWNGAGPGVFDGTESAINGAYFAPGSPMSDQMTNFGPLCGMATSAGFTQFGAYLNGNTVGFRLTHPVGAAPQLQIGMGAPQLLPATIGVPVPQMTAGATTTVTGSAFPGSTGKNVQLYWYGNAMPSATTEIIHWQQGSGPVQTTTLAGGSFRYTFAGAADTQYQFSVEDCDLLTCSGFSNSVTTSTGSGYVQLVLNGAQVGAANLDTSGAFSTPITIPGNTAPGSYPLSALVDGQTVATTTINVATSATPILEFWNGTSGSQGNLTCGSSPCQLAVWGIPLDLHGANYFPGVPVTITVTTAAGPETFTTTADSTGQFTIVVTPTGNGTAIEPVTATQFNGAYPSTVMVWFENQAG